MSKTQAIARLNDILRLPHSDLHRVGVAGATFRKVFLALQRPYLPDGEQRDDSMLYYKVYVLLDGELADITQLVATAIGDKPHKSGGIEYGIAEKVGTGYVSGALSHAIERKGEHFPCWGL